MLVKVLRVKVVPSLVKISTPSEFSISGSSQTQILSARALASSIVLRRSMDRWRPAIHSKSASVLKETSGMDRLAWLSSTLNPKFAGLSELSGRNRLSLKIALILHASHAGIGTWKQAPNSQSNYTSAKTYTPDLAGLPSQSAARLQPSPFLYL